MMKLTVAFLAALAAADAAEARSHRQARRQYGYGSDAGYGGSYDETPAVSSSVAIPVVSSIAVETPHESPVPYVQSSAEVFATSSSPADTTYPSATPTPAAGSDYGSGYGAAPPVGGESSKVPSPAESSSLAYPIGGGEKPSSVESYVPIESSNKPAQSSAYGTGFSQSLPVPSASGLYPSGGAAVPSGGYGQPQSSPVVPEAATSSSVGTAPYGTGYPAFPTGTGSSPASSTPLSDYVTKTIYSTQIFTKTACPSTVTDCPAKSTSLVTSVVAVGTTVCPESESPAATPVQVSTSEYPVSEVTNVVTETLVYTVGVGSSAHPVTTEVVSTSTSTVYSTVVVTLAQSTPAATGPAGGEGYPVASAAEEQTGTSTIKSTTTSTKYITVKPTSSVNVPVGSESYPTGPAGGEECAAPVTVTVTAKETVTVTKGTEQATGIPSEYPAGEKPTGETSKPTTQDSYPQYPASSAAALPTGKYPIGNNSTNPYPAGPTGFKTSTKPVSPTGTGYVVPTKPSETSSLPYFSFVSEVPSPTESATIPSVETEVPYSSAAPAAETSAAYPAGGEGYGAAPAASSPAATPYPSEIPSATSSEEQTYPTSTPAGNSYGSGYGTY